VASFMFYQYWISFFRAHLVADFAPLVTRAMENHVSLAPLLRRFRAAIAVSAAKTPNVISSPTLRHNANASLVSLVPELELMVALNWLSTHAIAFSARMEALACRMG
jgi:hypothetical protein